MAWTVSYLPVIAAIMAVLFILWFMLDVVADAFGEWGDDETD